MESISYIDFHLFPLPFYLYCNPDPLKDIQSIKENSSVAESTFILEAQLFCQLRITFWFILLYLN